LGDGEAGAVAFGDAAEGADGRPFHGRSPVGLERRVAGQGVGGEGALFAGDDGEAFLDRAEPVGPVVDDDVSRPRLRSRLRLGLLLGQLALDLRIVLPLMGDSQHHCDIGRFVVDVPHVVRKPS